MPRRSSFRFLLALIAALPAPAPAQELACPQFDFGEVLPDDAALAGGPLVFTADEADITRDGFSTLSGTVRLMQGGNVFETQDLSFDRQAQIVRVNAESLFRNPRLIIRSRKAEFDLANQTGTFHGTEFTLIERASRGEAEVIHLSRDGRAIVEDVYYTTCAPGSRAWFIEASEIELDQPSGLGDAKHARLRFGYVPILYLPWFRFPIDDRRRTGFLFPTIGESDNTGLDIRIPFYLNLGPNYDAQLIPRYMSERGTQIASEGRYLLRDHKGQVSYEYLDEDEQRGTERDQVNFHHQGLINRRLAVEARYAEVSDINYFEDLGGQLDAASITHLERSARLTYAAPAAYTIIARVTDFQTVSSTVPTSEEPYRRLPEVRVKALSRGDLFDTRLGFDGQYVNFSREIDVANQPGQGQRLDLSPYLRYQQERSAWYLASQLDIRHTRYLGALDDPDRTLPVFSIEGGLRFERLTDSGELQTLEPRLYYLYIPYRDQSALPVFDSGEPDFDFVQLFARNRFSGDDRISDANHIAGAFTTRLLDPDEGVVRMSASFGQIYRLEAPQVTINAGDPAPDRGVTDFLAGFDYRFSERWRMSSALQWSIEGQEFERSSVAVRYRGNGRRADFAYRYRRDLLLDPTTGAVFSSLEQGDASLATPIYGGWSVLGRWRYSLPEERTLESLGGLEYRTCCWALRAAYRRYQFNANLEYASGVYMQLELTGLARIGAGFRSLLPPLE